MRAARRFNRLWCATAALTITALASCTAAAQKNDLAAEPGTSDTIGGVGGLPSAVPGAPSSAAPADSAARGPVTNLSVPISDSSTDPTADSTDSTDAGATTTVATSADSTTSSSELGTTTTVPSLVPVGEHAAGNRLLMIGDSITASVSKRYGGEACQALVPLGWQVEVDAETSRFIDFGKTVLDKRLKQGWDAAIIFLGTNYGKNREVYEGLLHAMILRLIPVPVVLINTSLFRPEQQEVNDAIAEQAAQFTNVTVIDWAALTEADPSLTGGDSIHLTPHGRQALAYALAATMGPAPAQPGKCLDTSFHNDSGGSPYGPKGNETAPKTSVPKSRPTTSAPTMSSPTHTTESGGGGTSNTTATTHGGTTGSSTPTQTSSPTGSSSPTQTTSPSQTTTQTIVLTIPTNPPTTPAATSPPATTQPPATTSPPATTAGPPPTGP
jgi:hypothetical protein